MTQERREDDDDSQSVTWLCGKPIELENGEITRCTNVAGLRTEHYGFGHCRRHEDRAERLGWRLAMDLANELDVTPWEALLKTVRLCTGRMVQTELRLQHEERRHDGEEETSREVKYWRSESRRERMLAARASKAAIDAGVAERYVRQAEIEGSIVADALIAAFDSIPELTAQQRLQALTAAQSHLFAIEGTIVETNEKPDGELPPLMP